MTACDLTCSGDQVIATHTDIECHIFNRDSDIVGIHNLDTFGHHLLEQTLKLSHVFFGFAFLQPYIEKSIPVVCNASFGERSHTVGRACCESDCTLDRLEVRQRELHLISISTGLFCHSIKHFLPRIVGRYASGHCEHVVGIEILEEISADLLQFQTGSLRRYIEFLTVLVETTV